ncbi:15708_t:CDS:1, partial [Cetraspora pellucida]
FMIHQKLLAHERSKHANNKMIPHFYLLSQPTSEQLLYYINSVIVLVKKKLGFSKNFIGKKRFSIETFPENIFVYLFRNEKKFKYSSVNHKYQCCFEGSTGVTRLNQIFYYNYWNFRQNPITNTKEYVLLEDYENIYQIKFTWNQTTLLENNREFILGRMTCNFIADSKEFQE